MKHTSPEACARLKREFRYFSFLTEEDLEKLAPYFECRQVDAGKTIWKEGDECNYQAFIAEGSVQVKKETSFKGKEVVVGIYNSGTIVGELCMLNGSSRAVTASALKDTSLLILTRENFNKFTDDYPELGVKLLKGMLLAVSIRLRKSFDRLASVF
jgi:CRP-like cAMP-binding protein